MEVMLAPSSSDRQRAQERVLDRSEGKVVDRTMNINAHIASASDKEIIDDIIKLLGETGITNTPRERSATSILIDEEEPTGSNSPSEDEIEHRVPGTV